MKELEKEHGRLRRMDSQDVPYTSVRTYLPPSAASA